MDAFLNINKPASRTSFWVVARIKKVIGERKIGHGGTLDPMATGVFPVLLGKATRMAEYLHLFPKTYKAEIELGITTDTYDKEGSVISRSDASNVTRIKVEETLNNFKGVINQVVPPYSSAKFQGYPLYHLAREGSPVLSKQKQVQIYDTSLTSWQWPIFNIRVVCGKGTYLRSLAHELGQTLGCGATLNELIRESYGPFHLSESLSLDMLENIAEANRRSAAFYPLDHLFKQFSKVILKQDEEKALDGGQGLELETQIFPNRLDIYLPAYNSKGEFIGVLKEKDGKWRWHKVFCRV